MTDDIRTLLAGDRLNDLGPGSPNLAAKATLEAVASQMAKAGNRDFAAACMAGLWLLHDFHDQSHAISQDLDTREGSYWHAILHRREPEAWNSKYWFRRIGSHPVVGLLIAQAPALGYQFTSPPDFVDFCERVRGTGMPEENLAQRVQRLEWRLLFDYCYERV